jgi:hypothetical protein
MMEGIRCDEKNKGRRYLQKEKKISPEPPDRPDDYQKSDS